MAAAANEARKGCLVEYSDCSQARVLRCPSSFKHFEGCKPADITLYKTEFKANLNRNKFRICGLSLESVQDIKLYVHKLINSAIDLPLKASHIVSCERALSWGYNELSDIVVTFATAPIRNLVYDRKANIESLFHGDIVICDELTEERVLVWKRAFKHFGHKRISIVKGAVHVATEEGQFRVLTLIQLRYLLRRHIVRMEPIQEEDDFQ